MTRPVTRRTANSHTPVFREPDDIPSSLSHLIQLNRAFEVLICPDTHCRKAVQPHAFVEHLRVQHQTGLQERRNVAQYIEGFRGQYDFASIQLPEDGSSPQPELPVEDGFQCRQCPFKSSHTKRMRTHGIMEHGRKRASNEELFHEIRMQSWFKDHRQRYWAVEESHTRTRTTVSHRRRRTIMTSSDDDDEMVARSSRSSDLTEPEIAADIIVVSTGMENAGTTREVISIDAKKGEVVDAVVGDGTSEEGDDEGDVEDDDDEEYQEADDESGENEESEEDSEEERDESDEGDDISSVRSIEHSSVVRVSSEVASPCPAVTTKRKRSDDAGRRNEGSQDGSTEDSDACLVQPWQKRRQRLGVEKRTVQQRPVTGRFTDGGCIDVDRNAASATESEGDSEAVGDEIRQVQRQMLNEWQRREQQRQTTRQFEDSGIGIESDMSSEFKDVSVYKAADSSSSPEVVRISSPEVVRIVSIVSSQVINVPSSPPILRSSSRSPMDVPSSPPIFPARQEDEMDGSAARACGEPSPERPVSSDGAREPGLNPGDDGVRVIIENPVPRSQRCAEKGQHIDVKNRPMVWSAGCSGFKRSTPVRPALIRWMDWWSAGCPLCQWRGSCKINHRIEECDRDEARTIAAEAGRMNQEIRFGKFSCCYQCGVPQVICKRWQGGQACQYPRGVLTQAIVTMLQEGNDDVSDEVFRWMESSGADIWDRKSMYAWFGERYYWGGIEMSRLVRTFYKLVARHEK